MKQLIFKDISGLAEYMVDKASDGIFVVAALFFDETVELIQEFMSSYKDIDIGYLEVVDEKYNGYSKEYYISLSDDNVLCVEPAWVNNAYLSAEPEMMIIDGEANSRIIKNINFDNCRELRIGDALCYTKDLCHGCCKDCSGCKLIEEDSVLD